MIVSAHADIESHRLFLGEEVWTTYFLFSSTVGIMAFHVAEAIEKNSFDDFSPNSKILGPVAEERLNLKAETDYEVYIALHNRLILQLNSIISGKEIAFEGLHQAVELENIMLKLCYPNQFD